MKILILFLFLLSCASTNSNYNVKNQMFDFNENLTFDEFKGLLIKYAKTSPYPNIDK